MLFDDSMKKISIIEFILGIIFSITAIILSFTSSDFSQSKFDEFIFSLSCYTFELYAASIISFILAFLIYFRNKIFKTYNLLIIIPALFLFTAKIYPILESIFENRGRYLVKSYSGIEKQILFANDANKLIGEGLYKEAVVQLNNAINCAPKNDYSHDLRHYIEVIEQDTKKSQMLFDCIKNKKISRFNGALYSSLNILKSQDYSHNQHFALFIDSLNVAEKKFPFFYEDCKKFAASQQCDSVTLNNILSYYNSYYWFCFEEGFYSIQSPNDNHFYKVISNNIVAYNLDEWQKKMANIKQLYDYGRN